MPVVALSPEDLAKGADRLSNAGHSSGDRLVSVFVSHQQTNRNREVHEALTTSEVHIALRSGKLRFSPHLYNTDESVVRRYQAFDSRVGSIP